MTSTAAPGFVSFVRGNAPFLAAGFLISFWSSFGQTFFIALFAADIMSAFSLTDGGWGVLYAVATIASACAMVFAGVLTDRFRIRRLVVFVCLGLAAACLALAGASGWLMLGLAVFGLRFFGQGMMSHLAFVAMARWFIASRGKALAIAAMGFAVGQAVLPVVFVSAQSVLDWRWLLVVAAGLVLLIIPVLLRLLTAERTPQSIAADTPSPGLDGLHWTRIGMLRQPLFWMLVPLMLAPPAFGTALFFHQVHLVDTKGWALLDYVALLPLFTTASVASTFLFGALLDRFGSPRLMMIYLLPFALAFAILGSATTLWGAALALIVFGIGSGAQGTLPTACWAELFGTRHLGAIKSLSTAIMVFGSAIGPGLTGVIIDYGISFQDQMPMIALYFVASAILASVGLARALPRLPRAA